VELNQIAKNAIQEYRVNIEGVRKQFMGKIVEIDGNQKKKKIVEEMARLLTLKNSNAPRKPPRIALMGPPGVELSQHALDISTKYKLIFIDMDQLCKDYIRREGEAANDLREILKQGGQLPDELSMRLLRQRLDGQDCRTNGWILHGAPSNMD